MKLQQVPDVNSVANSWQAALQKGFKPLQPQTASHLTLVLFVAPGFATQQKALMPSTLIPCGLRLPPYICLARCLTQQPYTDAVTRLSHCICGGERVCCRNVSRQMGSGAGENCAQAIVEDC